MQLKTDNSCEFQKADVTWPDLELSLTNDFHRLRQEEVPLAFVASIQKWISGRRPLDHRSQ